MSPALADNTQDQTENVSTIPISLPKALNSSENESLGLRNSGSIDQNQDENPVDSHLLTHFPLERSSNGTDSIIEIEDDTNVSPGQENEPQSDTQTRYPQRTRLRPEYYNPEHSYSASSSIKEEKEHWKEAIRDELNSLKQHCRS